MNLTTVISIIGGICGALFGLAAFFRNKKSDDATEGKKDGTVLTELGYIKSGVDDIKRKQEKQEEQNFQFVQRLTEVETSIKQGHKRITAVEERVNHIEERV